MENMFSGCTSLQSLDLSNFDTSSVKFMDNMFNGCTFLQSLILFNYKGNDIFNSIETQITLNICTNNPNLIENYTSLRNKNIALNCLNKDETSDIESTYIETTNIYKVLKSFVWTHLINYKSSSDIKADTYIKKSESSDKNRDDISYKNTFITDKILNTLDKTIILKTTILDNANMTEISIIYYLAGFDNFIHSVKDKKASFNCYFIIKGISIPKIIIMYFELTYNKLRFLQNDVYNNEIVKGICKYISNEESSPIKYYCEFDTKGNNLINVKILEKFEFDEKEENITEVSLFAEIFITNLQNAKGEILNKSLFILNNSYIINNKNDFTIIGNLMENENEFNYKELYLIFSFMNENNIEKEIKNVSCNVSALNKSEYRLACKPNELLNGKILKGFSYLNNSNLIIIFNENRNNINVDPSNSHSSTYRIYTKKKKGLSSGEIVAIIVSCSCASIIIILVILFNKRKMLRKRQISIDSTFCSVKQRIITK
jgi:surface protein